VAEQSIRPSEFVKLRWYDVKTFSPHVIVAGMGQTKTARGKTIEEVLGEARTAIGAAKRNMKGFVSADAKKKVKRVTAATVKALESAVAKFDKAHKAQIGKKTSAKSGTVAERAARAALAAELVAIRSDITTSYEGDTQIQKAAGRGLDLQTRSSVQLLAHAENVTGALGDYVKRAADAGVDKKRFAKVDALAAALKVAQGGHGEVTGEAAALGKDARALLRDIGKQTTHIRKTANAVFRSDAKIRAQFAPTARKHAVQKRAPKAAPPEQSQILSKSATGVTKQAASGS
jgi:hypothetical protein